MNVSFTKLGASILATSLMVAAPAFASSHDEAEADAGSMEGGSMMVGGAEMMGDRTIVENAAESADHTTLVAAVQAAGLAETLSGEGPFTVFAPTNAAFDALPAGTVESLLEPANLEQLQTILTCHVLAMEAFSPAVGDLIAAGGGSAELETIGGCTLTASIRESDNALLITDENGTEAVVNIPDVDQSNGVVHVIDSVLLPAS